MGRKIIGDFIECFEAFASLPVFTGRTPGPYLIGFSKRATERCSMNFPQVVIQ